jgi:CheW-like domain
MREHVCARCGDFMLLFPAENIEFIEPVPPQMRFCAWTRRRRGRDATPVLDLRRLLAVREPLPAQNGVILKWRATTGGRQLGLLVDAVEEIVNCYAGDLIEVPILPKRLRPLCDQVMHDPSGRLRLRVKPDVSLPFERLSDKRRYARALLSTETSP